AVGEPGEHRLVPRIPQADRAVGGRGPVVHARGTERHRQPDPAGGFAQVVLEIVLGQPAVRGEPGAVGRGGDAVAQRAGAERERGKQVRIGRHRHTPSTGCSRAQTALAREGTKGTVVTAAVRWPYGVDISIGVSTSVRATGSMARPIFVSSWGE